MIPRRPRDPIELTTRDLHVIVPATAPDVRVVVGVTTRGPGPELERCLASVAEQECDGVGIVLLVDGVDVDDRARSVVLPSRLAGRCWVLAGNCGSASRARNAVLEFVDSELPEARWVARMDGDDRFTGPDALRAAVDLGDRTCSLAVLGGNRVLARDGTWLRDNSATPALLDPQRLLDLLADMAAGVAINELPSCNLMLRAGAGLRYPDMRSGEDHWLVTDLLVHRTDQVAVLEEPLFADYSLDGPATVDAKREARHRDARAALAAAARAWCNVRELPGTVLGLGQEGIVRAHAGRVFKHFYPGILDDAKVAWLERELAGTTAVPCPAFAFDDVAGAWIASYPHEITEPLREPRPEAVQRFVRECLRLEIVCANIKRSNFRVRADGDLVYVDIGNWIVPMDVSVLRDATARLYSIGVRGASDEELLRRPADLARPEIWTRLPGFSDFYGDVAGGWIRQAWAAIPAWNPAARARHPEVTLLLKTCAMDARDARAQIVHIVDQLARPRDFAERVLVVDPHPGPFPRAHAPGELPRLLAIAEDLVREGVLDRVLLSPRDEAEVMAVNRRWFGVDASHTHAVDGVPVTPQVWAFDQVRTRYVLQADIDVLVGRRRTDHDYLGEMVDACALHDVVGVAFDIPRHDGPRPYDAPPGEHKPEVRLGLLDLVHLRALLPLPAGVRNGHLDTTWYRALHAAQRARGLRTLRGGCGVTFYLHPPNTRKADADALGRVRDLIAQGIFPPEQAGRWDLEAPTEQWRYPARPEPVVVLARGRNTTGEKLERFVAGLAIQDDQSFGVIVVDDASDDTSPSLLRERVGWLGPRLTLVRNPTRRGHVANNRFAITVLCTNPESMVLVVDLDDALAHRAVVREVRTLGEAGHDIVLAAPFRPDVPTRVYSPDFDRVRETFGGDVWIHLRAFRKALFDGLPDAMFQVDGAWLDQLDDYATMIPIVARARAPVYLPRYRYWHERATVLDAAGEARRDAMILRLLAKDEQGEGRESGAGEQSCS
jgi:glycosyltransferase involved in cell wall biosynthesis